MGCRERGGRALLGDKQAVMKNSPTPLETRLLAELATGGPIPFRDFMERALYDSEYGYYATGRIRQGRKGDYVTNVSVGPLFGRLLARQFAEIWERLGRPVPFTVVEQGASAGDFARDALEGLAGDAPECYAAMEYRIVEPLEALRRGQAELLSGHAEKVHWHKDLQELPRFVGVHFSNELLDAFPVHLVRWDGERWHERWVQAVDGQLTMVDGALSRPELAAALGALPPVPADYETEVNLAARRWLAEVSEKLERGAVLVVDYGYPRAELYRPERCTGTLSAYASHQRVPDPLSQPGEVDLTSHVDFTSLTEQAGQCGLETAGFTDQHHFMVGVSGLHFRDDIPASPQEIRAFKTLMHPELFGQSFKVAGFSREMAPGLSGFKFSGNTRSPVYL